MLSAYSNFWYVANMCTSSRIYFGPKSIVTTPPEREPFRPGVKPRGTETISPRGKTSWTLPLRSRTQLKGPPPTLRQQNSSLTLTLTGLITYTYTYGALCSKEATKAGSVARNLVTANTTTRRSRNLTNTCAHTQSSLQRIQTSKQKHNETCSATKQKTLLPVSKNLNFPALHGQIKSENTVVTDIHLPCDCFHILRIHDHAAIPLLLAAVTP